MEAATLAARTHLVLVTHRMISLVETGDWTQLDVALDHLRHTVHSLVDAIVRIQLGVPASSSTSSSALGAHWSAGSLFSMAGLEQQYQVRRAACFFSAARPPTSVCSAGERCSMLATPVDFFRARC